MPRGKRKPNGTRSRASTVGDAAQWDNGHRPHGSLKSKPPLSRLGLPEDNLLRLHT
jgi:hypothetical protein